MSELAKLGKHCSVTFFPQPAARGEDNLEFGREVRTRNVDLRIQRLETFSPVPLLESGLITYKGC